MSTTVILDRAFKSGLSQATSTRSIVEIAQAVCADMGVTLRGRAFDKVCREVSRGMRKARSGGALWSP